jgi:hypothetical protein
MPTMSPDDAATLANAYANFAGDLVQYQADHGADPDVDQQQLSTLVSAVTQHSRTLANDAAATAFNDTAAAVQQLQKVTADAVADLATLTTQVSKYTRVANIASGIINIGVGLATGNAIAALKAADGLAACIKQDA